MFLESVDFIFGGCEKRKRKSKTDSYLYMGCLSVHYSERTPWKHLFKTSSYSICSIWPPKMRNATIPVVLSPPVLPAQGCFSKNVSHTKRFVSVFMLVLHLIKWTPSGLLFMLMVTAHTTSWIHCISIMHG